MELSCGQVRDASLTPVRPFIEATRISSVSEQFHAIYSYG